MTAPLKSQPVTLSPQDPEYTLERYDPSQAAAYLRIDRSTVYAEIHAGRIGHRRAGHRGRILMSQQDLDRWRQAQRQEPIERAPSSVKAPKSTAPARSSLPPVRNPRFRL